MFFQQINQLMGRDTDLILTIRKTGENALTVAVITKMNGLQDEAKHYIPPFTATGVPEELDQGFTSALAQPIPKAQGLLTNMKQFEHQLEVAEANSKAAKIEKDKKAKEEKERKEKSDKFKKKAEEQITAGKLGDAMVNLRQARLYADNGDKKKITSLLEDVQAKMCQGSLFGKTATGSSVTQQAVRPPAATDDTDNNEEDEEDEEDEDENEDEDPYNEIIDFPEECRAKDLCQNMTNQTLF